MDTKLEQLNSIAFFDLLNRQNLMAVLFTAQWSGESQIMESVLSKMQNDFANHIPIYKVDIEKEPSIEEVFRIFNLPTLTIFNNAQVIDSFIGLHSKLEIQDNIAKIAAIASDKLKSEFR